MKESYLWTKSASIILNLPVESHVQRGQASEYGRILPPFQRADNHRMAHPAHKRTDCDLSFQPCKHGSEARKRSVAEAQMSVPFPRNVKPVGIGELIRIAIGRSQGNQHRIACRNVLAVDCNVIHRDYSHELHGTV